jgi:preprotein translocase subunit SecA
VEAKEGVPVQRENQTLASITFQNYFRMYAKLAGMTGTADTEAYEFQTIYGLEVVVIPTHRPMVRKDHPDLVYLTKDAKFNAVLTDIKDCYQRGQPALVGTTSIETSQMLSDRLVEAGIPHEVLNAKQHEREAHIVANAGRPRAITIATNMAGRGTDIVLGGSLEAELQALGEDASEMDRARVKSEWQKRHDEVLALGGLHIVGTERHESRRIDNQLRGRAGRQGDAGSSRFYLSLEDNLMRIFAADWVKNAMRKMGMKEDEVIESTMVSKQIQNAQRKVEAHNFDIRKNLLDYDDVANDQRKVVYQQRNELLESESVQDAIEAIREDVVLETARRYVPENSIDAQWDIEGLERALADEFGIEAKVAQAVEASNHEIDDAGVVEVVMEAARQHFSGREEQIGSEIMRQLEKHLMLNVLDQNWKEHLARMDYLRQGIHLRGYAQKQPKQEYKRESFELFTELLDKVKREVTQLLARVRIRSEEEIAELEAQDRQRMEAQANRMQFQHPDMGGYGADEEAAEAQAAMGLGAAAGAATLRTGAKIGRNDPCPCGSGKKYKQCHGQLV